MAAGKTYEPISKQTLGTATATITFSSIPQTYTDLVCVVNGRTTADANIAVQFNSDTATNYSGTFLYGNGSSVTSARQSNVSSIGVGGISSASQEQGTNIIQIMNYANTTTNKTLLARANNSTYVQLRVGLYRSTSAITSCILNADGTTFMTGTTFTLYGIKAA
jgi:hypothetical protein